MTAFSADRIRVPARPPATGTRRASPAQPAGITRPAAPAPASPSPTPSAASPALAERPATALSVLLIDDAATVQQVVGYALRQAGFEVLPALDGEDAMRQLLARRVHAVVCDVAMPRLDGLTFLERMRQVRHLDSVPVVMLTNDIRRATRNSARELGAQAWINKPCPPDRLVAMIKDVIANP